MLIPLALHDYQILNILQDRVDLIPKVAEIIWFHQGCQRELPELLTHKKN